MNNFPSADSSGPNRFSSLFLFLYLLSLSSSLSLSLSLSFSLSLSLSLSLVLSLSLFLALSLSFCVCDMVFGMTSRCTTNADQVESLLSGLGDLAGY